MRSKKKKKMIVQSSETNEGGSNMVPFLIVADVDYVEREEFFCVFVCCLFVF